MQYLETRPEYLPEDAITVEVLRNKNGGMTIYFSPRDNAYIYYIAGNYTLETIHESMTVTESHRRREGTLFDEQYALLDFTHAYFDLGNLMSFISRTLKYKASGKWMPMFSMRTPRGIQALNKVFEVRAKEPAFGEVNAYQEFLLAISLLQNEGKDATSDTNGASSDADGSVDDVQSK